MPDHPVRKSALNLFTFVRARRIAVALLILWFAIPASSQVNARVHGLVQGASGSPVAGARVVAHSAQQNTDRASVSGADGSFTIDELSPGHYQFKATMPGFADSLLSEEDLAAGEDQMLNLTLRANEGFLKRLSRAYANDWKGTVDSGPEPPRRALPSP